jgi:hypothetical protein
MTALRWQKASFSTGDGNYECLELATAPHALLLRESDEPDVTLAAHPTRVAALLAAIKVGGWRVRRQP